MWRIINLFQWVLIFSSIIFSGILAILSLLISKKLSFWVAKNIWSRSLCAFVFSKVSLFNKQRLQSIKNESVMYCANHQSMYDIPALFIALDKPIHFIAKKELKKIPFIGWYVTAAGMIFIDRTNREKAMQSMKKAGTLIKNGRNVITFPEGTRSSDGKLNLFKRGSLSGEIEKDFYGNILKDLIEVNSKVIVASEKERLENSRSRSAKLRIAEKIEN